MSEPFDLGLGNADVIARNEVETLYRHVLALNAPAARLVRGKGEFRLSPLAAADVRRMASYARQFADDMDAVLAAQSVPQLEAAE